MKSVSRIILRVRNAYLHFRRNGEGLAAPREGNVWNGLAREGVQTLLRVVQLCTRNLGVERLDGAGRAVDEGGTRVDDGVEVGVGGLATEADLTATGLPEAGLLDSVVLYGAGV